mmetsp:Transcript_15182/g.30670  ORF Transcript_15182/g.30670 Transcript_15182/m.30670 type:complete len:268 (+) Transcript_15182:694-1497(+)
MTSSMTPALPTRRGRGRDGNDGRIADALLRPLAAERTGTSWPPSSTASRPCCARDRPRRPADAPPVPPWPMTTTAEVAMTTMMIRSPPSLLSYPKRRRPTGITTVTSTVTVTTSIVDVPPRLRGTPPPGRGRYRSIRNINEGIPRTRWPRRRYLPCTPSPESPTRMRSICPPPPLPRPKFPLISTNQPYRSSIVHREAKKDRDVVVVAIMMGRRTTRPPRSDKAKIIKTMKMTMTMMMTTHSSLPVTSSARYRTMRIPWRLPYAQDR